jgi:hypothetical protein
MSEPSELGELSSLVERLSEDDPTIEQLNILPRVQAAIARERERPARATWRWLLGVATGAVAVSGAVALGMLPRPAAEFRSKGTPAASAGQWAGVAAYRVEQGRKVGRVEHALRPNEALAFDYRNGGSSPFSHLALFATDATGHVFWYYPAWQSAGEDPSSVAIQPTAESVELPEAIRHAYQPGPLYLHALFTRRAWRVSEMEARLNGADPSAPLEWPDGLDQRLELSVER